MAFSKIVIAIIFTYTVFNTVYVKIIAIEH